MEFNKKRLARSELIGLDIEVTESENRFNRGLKGKIIDETKNMFMIKTKETRKKIIKDQCVFEFKLNGKNIQINGKSLSTRPEERLVGTRHRGDELPSELSKDLETYLDGIFNLIRNYRNEAGHPSGKEIPHGIAYSNLQLFRFFSKNVHGLIKYLSSNKI